MFSDNLEFVSILVVGSSITTNDKGKEQLTFVVSIGQENQNPNSDSMMPHKEQDELWRVEKQYMEFVNLDSKVSMVLFIICNGRSQPSFKFVTKFPLSFIACSYV